MLQLQAVWQVQPEAADVAKLLAAAVAAAAGMAGDEAFAAVSAEGVLAATAGMVEEGAALDEVVEVWGPG